MAYAKEYVVMINHPGGHVHIGGSFAEVQKALAKEGIVLDFAPKPGEAEAKEAKPKEDKATKPKEDK